MKKNGFVRTCMRVCMQRCLLSCHAVLDLIVAYQLGYSSKFFWLLLHILLAIPIILFILYMCSGMAVPWLLLYIFCTNSCKRLCVRMAYDWRLCALLLATGAVGIFHNFRAVLLVIFVKFGTIWNFAYVSHVHTFTYFPKNFFSAVLSFDV